MGDVVLIMAHNFPFALVTVSGDYNYIRTPDPEIGVWFRHFRRIIYSRAGASARRPRDWDASIGSGPP